MRYSTQICCFTLRNDYETQKKCKLLTVDNNKIFVVGEETQKGKGKNGCCESCKKAKSCTAESEEPEDVQLLVPTAPPKKSKSTSL